LPFNLIPLKKGDYPHYKGQHWADPDISYGINKLIELQEDYDALELVRTEAKLTAHQYTPFRIGLKYADAIHKVLGK
jgi:hypothetical protein